MKSASVVRQMFPAADGRRLIDVRLRERTASKGIAGGTVDELRHRLAAIESNAQEAMRMLSNSFPGLGKTRAVLLQIIFDARRGLNGVVDADAGGGGGGKPRPIRPGDGLAESGGTLDFPPPPIIGEDLLYSIKGQIERSLSQSAQLDRNELCHRYETLTPREREVFALVTAGLLNKQAGAELGITEKTVKVHRGRVMDKMEADSLATLVRMSDRLSVDSAAPLPKILAAC